MGGRQHKKIERLSYAGRRFVVALEVCSGGGASAVDVGHAHHTSSSSGGSDDVKKAWPTAMYQMMDTSGDFPPRTHHLSRW